MVFLMNIYLFHALKAYLLEVHEMEVNENLNVLKIVVYALQILVFLYIWTIHIHRQFLKDIQKAIIV